MTTLHVVPAYGPRGFSVFDTATGQRVVSEKTGKIRVWGTRAAARAYIDAKGQ